ncbi:hypothetical protein F751_3573 [Auxenochlorella protothecoides]|uniref:Uncharacterized protein n=1 Tax=Auxenochlorella protothecoides TaxID=3075 RepID=A0A087SSN9_AUXPR|nr:hypothetical protein F751_3573 [Auxenochlorella protothecoides]KFM28743.1 hypothetical protein F751_3573 [Auxenochlorella protothecoides]
MEALPASSWGVTLCFKDPQLEADFCHDHARQHRREDAMGSFLVAILLYVMIVLTKTAMTDQEWSMPMDELRPMGIFATVEALPGLLAVLLPSQTYLRHRTRIHQASLLATAAFLPFHGYRRSPDFISGEEDPVRAARRAASRLAGNSRFVFMVFELLGRQLLLRHRLPFLLPWVLVVLQCNMDVCRARPFTAASGVAIHEAHAVIVRVANTGLGEWPLGPARSPTQACAVVTNWWYLVMGLVFPNIVLYTMEVRDRSRYLVERGLPPPRLKLSKGLADNFLLLPSVLGGMWLLANALAAVPPNRLSALPARWNAYLMQTRAPETTW